MAKKSKKNSGAKLIVTAIHFYNFATHHWESKAETFCKWCGQKFPVSKNILDFIYHINRANNIGPNDSPCLKLPEEVWDEPGLLSQCPKCGKPLKFNPFIVDNRERY